MELNDWIIEYGQTAALLIGVLAGVAILALVSFAGTFLAGTKALEYGKLLVAELKGQRARIIEAVDDPTDKINVEIARLVPGTWDTPEMWSALLTGLVRTVLAAKEAEAKTE